MKEGVETGEGSSLAREGGLYLNIDAGVIRVISYTTADGGRFEEPVRPGLCLRIFRTCCIICMCAAACWRNKINKYHK